MRVGCGSATIGMFAPQWRGHVDEVIVVDDHITGVLSEHQAGKFLGMKPAGIRVRGRRSTPGRYFQVAEPGLGWGGTNVSDPLDDHRARSIPRQALARPAAADGLDHRRAFGLVRARRGPEAAAGRHAGAGAPRRRAHRARTASRRCAPCCSWPAPAARCAPASPRIPVRLTRSVQRRADQGDLGGAPVYVWPGGGITLMVDVARMPENAFGYVPTPALVAPIEFTLRADDYAALGGYASRAVHARATCWPRAKVRVDDKRAMSAIAARLPDGRLHLQHGPIDLIVEAFGEAGRSRARLRPGRRAFRRHPADPGARAADPAPARGRRLSAAAGPGGAPHGRGRVAASRRLHHAHGRRRGRASPTRCCRRWWRAARSTRPMSTTAATSPSISRRATSCAPASSPTALDGVAPSDARSSRARHCDLGLGRPLLFARHRRFGHRAGGDRAAADAAATLIANAVNIDHPAIKRRPARDLDPDSDLGDLPVTVAVGSLPADAVEKALDRGAAEARRLRLRGLIEGAALSLLGRWRLETSGTVLAHVGTG